MDCWVVRIDSLRNILWQRSLGGSGNEWVGTVKQTTDGGFIASASSNSHDGDVTTDHGDYDYWTVKLNNTGDILWQESVGGNKIEVPTPVEQTPDGGYIIAGWSASNNWDVSGNHGYNDYWVVKLSACSVNPGTISGDTIVCLGDSTLLSETVPGGTWSLINSNAVISAGMVLPVTPGLDTAIYRVTESCGYSTTAYTLTIEPLPGTERQHYCGSAREHISQSG